MGAGDTGLRAAEGCLRGEEVGPDPPALGCASLGHAVTSLGTSCLVPAPALLFPVGILTERGRRSRGGVDVSPLVLVFQIFSLLKELKTVVLSHSAG